VLYPSEGTQSIAPAMVLDAVQALLPPAGGARRLAGEP